MIDNLDVERIMNERIMEKTKVPTQCSRLIHHLKDETADEMKDIIRENRDLQYVKIWLQKKTKDLNKILKNEKIEPVTPAYITIRQIGDAAAHFVALYRANKKIARSEKLNE